MGNLAGVELFVGGHNKHIVACFLAVAQENIFADNIVKHPFHRLALVVAKDGIVVHAIVFDAQAVKVVINSDFAVLAPFVCQGSALVKCHFIHSPFLVHLA